MPSEANRMVARMTVEISRLRREVEGLRAELNEARNLVDQLVQAQCQLIDEVLTSEAKRGSVEEAWAAARAYLAARTEVEREEGDCDVRNGCL